MKTPSVDADQLASAATLLEQLLPHGYSLTRTRNHWYLRTWDSWLSPTTGPRMAWRDVDDDKSLSVLLARLGEGTP